MTIFVNLLEPFKIVNFITIKYGNFGTFLGEKSLCILLKKSSKKQVKMTTIFVFKNDFFRTKIVVFDISMQDNLQNYTVLQTMWIMLS